MKLKKSPKTTRQKLMDMTFIALFAAVSYMVLVVLFIPFANMYIHFGNLVVVLAALLVGGWQGGLAGSIGMGLYDLLNGHPDSCPKTFLMKFLIGLTVGAVYTLLTRRKKFPDVALFVSGGVSLGLAIGLLSYTLCVNHAFTGKCAVLCPIFFVLGLMLILFGTLKKKFSPKTASAVVAACCGMTVNLIGETMWKLVFFLLSGSGLKAATAGAVVSQASTLINAGIAVVGAVALFTVLEKPVGKIFGKDKE